MSAPNEPARQLGSLPGSAGRLTADGRRIYRLDAPLIIWWAWVAVIGLSLADLVLHGRDLISLKFALGLLAATGLVFACTMWPRVIASDRGLTVLNPFRSFDIPWDAVNGIFLADSVEVQCVRGAGKKDKIVYSWALAAPRRQRARAQLRGRQWDRGRRGRPSSYDRLPGQAKEIAKLTAAEVIARELAGISEQVRSSCADDATAATVVMSARWAWQPLAAILVPGIAFLIAQLIG